MLLIKLNNTYDADDGIKDEGKGKRKHSNRT